MKNYIHNNLNPSKVNVIEQTIDNFTEPLNIKEILDELEISKDDYYRALSIPKDENLELHLKRKPTSCFVNNYFHIGLKAWQANMEIQPVFSKYEAVTYMCQYFSKIEDQCSQAMKHAAKKVFENNMHHHDTMKTFTKAYLSSRVFCTRGSLPYFARIEAKENLSGCFFFNTKIYLQKNFAHHVLLLFYPIRDKKELSTATAKSSRCCKHK